MCVDRSLANRGGESVVVGEDDHLPRLGEIPQDVEESVDLGGVHGLDRVVEDDEPERTGRSGGTRQEAREGEGVKLALTHHRQHASLPPVYKPSQHGLSASTCAFESNLRDVHIALLAQSCPNGPRPFGNGFESLFSQRLGIGAHPVACLLE